MAVTVKEVAEWVQGEVVGDGSLTFNAPKALSDAGPGDLTFVDGEKNLKTWQDSKASAAVVSKKFPTDCRTFIVVDNPLAAFMQIVVKLRGERKEVRRIDPSASVHPTAKIGPNAKIDPFVVVGEGSVIGDNVTIHSGVVIGHNCKLGNDVTLYPRVVIYDDSILGNRVAIHAGAIIGADGFGYRLDKGKHVKIPQLGHVEIGDDVEIGANTTVDRGTFGPTRIGEGSKLDNLVMISHNCQLGRHNIIVSQVGIAGSTTTGDYVVMAGQVGIADHIIIGDQAQIGAQCGVMQDVPAKAKMVGSPAMEVREFFRTVMNWGKISDIRKDVTRIKKHLNLEDAG